MGKQRIDMALITVQRAKELESEIKALENMMRDDIATGRPKIQDKKEFVGQITKRKKELTDFGAREFKEREKNEAYDTAKRLRKYIQKRMPSSRDYHRGYPKSGDGHSTHGDFEKAVQQQMAFQTNPRLQKAVTIYKNLMQRIDPSDPTVRNIEMLRK